LGNALFRKALFRQLGTDFSRLRMQRSVFMMYSLIDAAVAQLAPVIDMYRMRLDWYTQMIRTKKWRFGNRIRGLLDTKRELEKLCEQIRPCISVVRHLINDDGLAPSAAVIAAMGRPRRRNDRSAAADSAADAASSSNGSAQKELSSSPLPPQRTSPLWDETLHKLHALGRTGFSSAVGGSGVSSEKRQGHQSTPAEHQLGDVDAFFGLAEIKQYFEDIDDALAMNLENLRRMADLCASYTAEFESYGDKRMNDILFVLTIVTTLFVPAQFFTGVFGMNFVKPDGTPNMPLLTWRYGYFFFWMLSLTLTAFTFLGLFVQGWMPCERCNRCADRLSRDEGKEDGGH
jgi:Mg2+ and Co2+ transporter CorA